MRQTGEERTPAINSAKKPYGRFRPLRKSRKLHMPKHYACPLCMSTSKRISKLPVGAMYRCCTHGEFLVRREHGHKG